ncbi:MAG: M55 family metallopeptidase [Candidatus Brocadiia bacterium]
MKVFVMTDMEGVSGVSQHEYVSRGERLYQEGRRFLTLDVNACVEGLFAGGADEVVVKDAHGGRGGNLLWEELDPRADYLMGETGRQRLAGIGTCDAVVLLGFHAMAGTAEAILEHTMSSASWQNFYLNGRRIGEIGIDAAIAGENGVPAVMLSGDDKACREAQQFIPGIVTACVKWGLCREGGRLLPPARAHALITEAACEAVQKADAVEPFVIEPPVTARLERVSKGRLPNPEEKPYVSIIDGRTYEVTADSVEQALRRL